MSLIRHAAAGGRRAQPNWSAVIKFVWVALIIIVCVVLGDAMVHHLFFTGGALNDRISHTKVHY